MMKTDKTERQEQSIRNRIKKIRAALAADKKQWGGYYHDGQGLRYQPPKYFIQLGDYSGGFRYLSWFNRTFPDDAGYPDFLFEWTILLFKTGRKKVAGKLAFRTFCRNTYLLDRYFGLTIVPLEKQESSNLETSEFAEKYFSYSSLDASLEDFTLWLRELTGSEKFIRLKQEFLQIQTRLKTESDSELRHYLVERSCQMEDEF